MIPNKLKKVNRKMLSKHELKWVDTMDRRLTLANAILDYYKRSPEYQAEYRNSLEYLIILNRNKTPFILSLTEDPKIRVETKIIYIYNNLGRKLKYDNDHELEKYIDIYYQELVDNFPDIMFERILARKDSENIAKYIHALGFYLFVREVMIDLAHSWPNKDIRKIMLSCPRRSARFIPEMDYSMQQQPKTFFQKMIEANPATIKRTPRDKITRKMAITAVSKSGSLLAHVPSKLRTQKICDIAFENTPSALAYIPEKYQNRSKIMLKALHGEKVTKYIKGKI